MLKLFLAHLPKAGLIGLVLIISSCTGSLDEQQPKLQIFLEQTQKSLAEGSYSSEVIARFRVENQQSDDRIEVQSATLTGLSIRGDQLLYSGNLDYEQHPSHSIEIQVLRRQQLIQSQRFELGVINIDDSPTQLESEIILEQLTIQDQAGLIARIQVIDADNLPFRVESSPSEYIRISTNQDTIAVYRTAQLAELFQSADTSFTVNIEVVSELSRQGLELNFLLLGTNANDTLATRYFTLNQGVQASIQYQAPNNQGDSFRIVSQTPGLSVVNHNPDLRELTLWYDSDSLQTTITATLNYHYTDTAQKITAKGLLVFQVTPKDPLFRHQWGLDNTAQKAFADFSGLVGMDLNLSDVHRQGILGRGIKVAIVDDEVEMDHEDLKNQINPNGSYDFAERDLRPTPNPARQDSSHGTMVAGIVAMQGWNHKGGVGVAPKADLHIYNYLSVNNIASFYSAHGADRLLGGNYGTNSEQVDVFNLSYGIEHMQPQPFGSFEYHRVDFFRCATTGQASNDFESVVLQPCQALRNGKGAIYVKAAGNDFLSESEQHPNCLNVVNGLSCDIAAGREVSSNHPFQVVIGGLAANGKKASYSTAGSGLWLVAPAGEFGLSKEPLRLYDENRYRNLSESSYRPAIVTTDRSGCSSGLDYESRYYINGDPQKPISATLFHGIPRVLIDGSVVLEPHPSNPNCSYTSMMNGTSAAAPMVSGVVALLLEVNSDLTWRDVKFILAKTARQVDADIGAYFSRLSNGFYTQRHAWRTNAAGFKFHNWYGFGLVDAKAAVAMAKTYTQYRTNQQFMESDWQTMTINKATVPANSTQAGWAYIDIPETLNIERLEAVQIRITLSDKENPQDLNIRIISPSAMLSQVLHAHTSLQRFPSDMSFISNAFYEEAPTGRWRVEVVSSNARTENIIREVKIRFSGQKS